MKRTPILLVLLAGVIAGSLPTSSGRAANANPSASKGEVEEKEIRIPPEYARAKLQFYSDPVPPARYRAVVDVGRKLDSTRIATSSGNAAVDRVAMDFADAYATQIKSLRELRRSRELRFPLVFDLRGSVGVWTTPLTRRNFSLSTRARYSGAVLMRVSTGADGRVKDARMVVKSGFPEIDKSLEDDARKHWTGPPNSATIIRTYLQWRPR